jgi:RecJ-like exonuclease
MGARKCAKCGGTGAVKDIRCAACRGNGLVITQTEQHDPESLRSIIEAVKVIPLRPDDVIVCKIPSFLPDDDLAAIRDNLSEAFGGHRVIVLSGGMDIEVVRREAGDVA